MTNPSPTFPQYPADAAAVVKSDTATTSPSVIWVGTGGNVRVLTAAGSDVTFPNVLPGAVLPVQVVRVFATNTTATDLIRIY